MVMKNTFHCIPKYKAKLNTRMSPHFNTSKQFILSLEELVNELFIHT